MGWADCGTTVYKGRKRRIGYAFAASCDHPKCFKKIDRGLGYACGGMHGEMGGRACEGYFCGDHLRHTVPAEEEDILANLEADGVRTITVCAECWNNYLRAYQEADQERQEELRLEALAKGAKKKPGCDCHRHHHQVCDRCQGWTGKAKDRKPKGGKHVKKKA